MGDRSAFFYGTLMVRQVLNRVCYGDPNPSYYQANLLTITPAILPAFTRYRVRYCDYPAIVPSSLSSSVRGTYVRGLTDGDIWRLDIFEGPEYKREKVKIRVLDKVGNDVGQGNVEGDQVEVETYIWIAGNEALEDCEWDFAEFKREKLRSWVYVDDHYGDLDEAVKGQNIDSTGGRGIGGTITEHRDTVTTKDLQSAV